MNDELDTYCGTIQKYRSERDRWKVVLFTDCWCDKQKCSNCMFHPNRIKELIKKESVGGFL